MRTNIHRVVRRGDLKTAVYKSLRRSLERGEMRPGTFSSAGELSRRLEVSRTPVREALLQLQEEGFIEMVPFRGARVPRVTTEDVRSVYEARSAIEGYATWRAAHDMSKAEVDIVRSLLTAQEASRNSQTDEWLKATEALHRYVIERLGNKLLSKQIAQLLGHHARIRRLAAGMNVRRETAISEHRRITGALIAGDASGAHTAMVEHLMSVASDVRSLIAEPGTVATSGLE